MTEVLVTAGSRVAAGDALAVLGGSAAASALENAAITLENARLNLQSAQDALNNYTITAPISGTVVEKSFKAGDKIESEALSAANGTLATLYDMSQLTFRMAVNELDINKVAVGQRVEITTEALSGQIFTGTVDKVNINGTTTNGLYHLSHHRPPGRGRDGAGPAGFKTGHERVRHHHRPVGGERPVRPRGGGKPGEQAAGGRAWGFGRRRGHGA